MMNFESSIVIFLSTHRRLPSSDNIGDVGLASFSWPAATHRIQSHI
jgi:hypothetical protein